MKSIYRRPPCGRSQAKSHHFPRLGRTSNLICTVCVPDYEFVQISQSNERTMTADFASSFTLRTDDELRAGFLGDTLIPRLLHLIWVGPNPEPDTFAPHVAKWKELMPDWTVRVWCNADINEDEFPAEAVTIINSAAKGAQKADIMRYFIIRKHGGVYMDADVVPHRALGPCLAASTLVLCHDLELTWPYISIGFMAAVPDHPVFRTACDLCLVAKLNTPDVHMHTGPRVLGEAVNRTRGKAGEYSLLPISAFYRNHNFPGRFGTHTYAKMW